MSDCQSFESAIEAYLDDALDEASSRSMLAHVDVCQPCRALIALHRDLTAVVVPEPDDRDFDAMRARLLARVAEVPVSTDEPAVRPPMPIASPSWQAWNVTIRPVRLAMALAAGAAVFVVGMWVGSEGLASSPRLADGRGTAVEGGLVRAMGAEAASNRVLADVEDSRFILSNVSFRRADEGYVAVDFDVTTHVGLVEPARSALMDELLVQSLLNPSTTGTRLKAIAYAAQSMTPKVTEAVIFALRHDESLAVRLQALTMLSDQLAEPRVETAVMATLRDDTAVQMRLLALEYLAEHRVDGERLRQVIETNARPDDRALMVRLTQYEQL